MKQHRLLGVLGALAVVLATTGPPASAQAADPAVLYHQHILAINRGDLPGIMAGYAPDAVFVAPGGPPCAAAAPCAGKEAVQGLFQGLLAAHLQAGIIDLQASGNTLTGRLNIVTDGIRAAGFGVARIKVTVTFAGDLIARDVVEYDLSDAATAAYARYQARAALVRQHYQALDQGDVARALGALADDATYLGAGGCRDVPCVGRSAIQAEFQRQVQNQARFEIAGVRPSTEGVVADVTFRSRSTQAAGVERAIQRVNVLWRGEKISAIAVSYDLEDPASRVFVNWLRVGSVLSAFETAMSAGDVERALALLADDAVVRVSPAPGVVGIYRGKSEVREIFVERQIRLGIRFVQPPRERRVEGERVTQVSDLFRSDWDQLGVTPVQSSSEAIVREGKIASLDSALTADSAARIEAARQALQPAAAPAALPAAGDEPLALGWLGLAGLLAVAGGLATRRLAGGARLW